MNEQEVGLKVDEFKYSEEEAVRLLDEALNKVDDDELYVQLQDLRKDHEQHAQQLDQLAHRLGRAPQDPGDEFRALAEQELKMVQMAASGSEVLDAVLLIEREGAANYASAMKSEVPAHFSEMLSGLYRDELRHVRSIEQIAPRISQIDTRLAADDLSCMTGGLTDDKNPDDFDG